MTIAATAWRRAFSIAVVVAFWAAGAAGKPFVPEDDAVVLVRLPEQADPSLKELRRVRASLAGDSRNLEAAAAVAQRAIEAARETGDPRFLGQAQAALAPWWTAADPPSRVLLLRATLKQSQHDFAGALADLDRMLVREPGNGQALLTRATVLTVTGEYAKARSDCAKLVRVTSPLVVTACLAGPSSVSGESESAYRGLVQALARSGEAASVRVWAFTLAAEIAARRGDPAAAERNFREALSQDARDPYLRGAYADFLLDQRRPHDVLPLVRDDTQNDALLLRLALAEQALPEARAAFEAHRLDLAARFDAARARGDSLHRREEARFRLLLGSDPRGALALARDNWAVQREAADLRILADAARAADDREAQKVVDAWIASNRVEDATLAAGREARR